MTDVAPLQQMIIDAIRDPLVPALVLAELAETVADDARYSVWFAEKKGSIPAGALLALLAAYQSAFEACERAWSQYVETHSVTAEPGLIESLKEVRRVVARQMVD